MRTILKLGLLVVLLAAPARAQIGGGASNIGGGTGTGTSSGNGVGFGASPILAVYISPQCPVANTGNCFNTPADTQQSQACSWTAATPSTVTCGIQVTQISGSVTTNVATYSTNNKFQTSIVPSNWVGGNSVTITGFSGADTFLNQTCTITSTTATTIVCPLTHANGSSTTQGIITNTTLGPFVTGDVGKQVMGWHDCQAFQTASVMGTNAITVNGAPTISSYVSPTQVQITTAANAQSTQTGCFVWGHPDDAGFAAAEAAYVNYPFCPRVELAASNYLLTQPHLYNNPLACASEGVTYPFTTGNVFYSASLQVVGRGNGNTVIYLATNFPNGDPCTRGTNSDACFVIPPLGEWRDFQMTGGSQAGTNGAGPGGITGTHALVNAIIATVEHVTCTNWGAFTTGGPILVGLERDWQVQTYQYNNSGCGNIGEDILANKGGNVSIRDKVENSLLESYFIFGGSTFVCYECSSFGSQNNAIATPTYGIVNNGSIVTLYRSSFSGGGSGNTQSGANKPTGYLAQTAASTLITKDTFFTPGGPGSYAAIVCTFACTNYLQNTQFTTSGGASYSDVAGSVLYDEGGNLIPPLATMSISGQWIGEANSINQVLVTAAKLVLSVGWGSTAAWTALSGGDFPIQGTITNSGTGQGASPTISYTFPTNVPVAPYSCTATQVGGTNATGTFTSSALSGSGVIFTFSLTPTAASTEIVQINCVTP